MDCACLSVVLVLLCSLPDVGIRIRLGQGFACLRGPGARRCDVVWWCKFLSRCCCRFCVGQRYVDEGKILHQFLSVPRRRVALSCGGGGFTRYGAYDFVWDSVRPMPGKFAFNYFQYQWTLGVFAC